MDTWALSFGLTTRQRVSKSNDYLSPETTSNQPGIARVMESVQSGYFVGGVCSISRSTPSVCNA